MSPTDDSLKLSLEDLDAVLKQYWDNYKITPEINPPIHPDLYAEIQRHPKRCEIWHWPHALCDCGLIRA